MNNLADYIVKFNGMEEDLCKKILDEYASSEEWTDPVMNGTYVPEVRNCKVIEMSNKEVIDRNKEVREQLDAAVFKAVSEAGAFYKEKFPRVDFNYDTGYHLLRYEPGEYIKQHIDTGFGDHRVVSCSIQLNGGDCFSGGSWSFFDDDKYSLQQDVGDIVMFPANFCFPHQIVPVESGTRYSIITWLNLR